MAESPHRGWRGKHSLARSVGFQEHVRQTRRNRSLARLWREVASGSPAVCTRRSSNRASDLVLRLPGSSYFAERLRKYRIGALAARSILRASARDGRARNPCSGRSTGRETRDSRLQVTRPALGLALHRKRHAGHMLSGKTSVSYRRLECYGPPSPMSCSNAGIELAKNGKLGLPLLARSTSYNGGRMPLRCL